jgi:ParB family chromosome partitioning protein
VATVDLPREPPSAQATLSPEDAEIVRLFEEALGNPVQLARGGKSIKLTITLFGEEELQGLYDLITGNRG